MLTDIKIEQINTNTGRFYLTPNGDRYPSITTVLGKIPNDGIKKWRENIGEEKANKIMLESSTVGTIYHELCENYLLKADKNKIDVTDYNLSNIAHRLYDNVKSVLDQFTKIYGTELSMYSDSLKLAGTADCIAEYKGKTYIVDFKNSRKEKRKDWIKNYFMQGAAYSNMLYERYDILAKDMLILVATWDNKIQLFEEKVLDHYNDLIDINKKYNQLWN